MSSLTIVDLAHSAKMDRRALAAVRGGAGIGQPNVNVNVMLDQQIGQFQEIGVNVLNNNGVIGAGVIGPDVGLAATQWTANHAAMPKFPA